MIDYEAVQKTARGKRFDLFIALLIGLVAVVAAALVVLQTTTGLTGTRANVQARMLASEITTRIIASGTLQTAQLGDIQLASVTSAEGIARGMAALTSGDVVQQAISEAMMSAGSRLQAVAAEMVAVPGRDTPLDEFAARSLATEISELKAMLVEQNRQVDLGIAASNQGNASILGLSLVALGGVLVGLAAVLGSGRAGRSLLVVAWGAALGATVLLAVAAGLIPPLF
jgi:hypothetical protein